MLIQPFFSNKRKEIVKAPKVYFYDTGLRNYAAGNFSRLPDRVDSGHLNENFIATELLKRDIEFRYWRTKAKAEVDFIIESAGIIPIEVKSGLKTAKMPKSFISFIGKYNPEMGLIFSNGYMDQSMIKDKKIYFLPLMLL